MRQAGALWLAKLLRTRGRLPDRISPCVGPTAPSAGISPAPCRSGTNRSASSRWIGTNTDIEDQKAAVHELARLNATLEEQVARRTQERDRVWRVSRERDRRQQSGRGLPKRQSGLRADAGLDLRGGDFATLHGAGPSGRCCGNDRRIRAAQRGHRRQRNSNVGSGIEMAHTDGFNGRRCRTRI